jgi:hypothetical protein
LWEGAQERLAMLLIVGSDELRQKKALRNGIVATGIWSHY